MGATIIIGMKAAAFRRPDGRVTYLLFEHTYEKNLYPHTPRWSCVAIGAYEDVLKRIFEGAAACEGGSLRARTRTLIPERFLQRWQRELRAPVTMPDVPVPVRTTLPYASDDENAQYQAQVYSVLGAQGRPDLADGFQSDRAITLALHADIDLVVALYGAGGPGSSWHAVTAEQALTVPMAELAPPAATQQVVPPAFEVWALDENVRVGSVGGEPVEVLGWEYRAVGNFMLRYVYPLELQRTGVAGALIRKFRDACTAAPRLPDATRLTLRLGDAPDTRPWQLERAMALAMALGVNQDAAVSVTLGDIRRIGGVWDLQSLSPAQLVWDEASITGISPKPVSAA
ncbi:hypothetical protein ACS7SF_09980 [Ralstonia sp. 25C]|uniref:hypothetical protein n=1 Tax=Ralstonia sp. 25C TaxID=3447363 RepID=UPI003F751BB0